MTGKGRGDGRASQETSPLSAGGFGAWLDEMRAALVGGGSVDVPCGSCDACCRSSMFIQVEPDEAAAIKQIPKALRFAAPGLKGHTLMPYDQHGKCPMLKVGGCQIYEVRPRACRAFDCRVFAAAGLVAGTGASPMLAHAQRWRFDYPTAADADKHAQVRQAAAFIQTQASHFPGGRAPTAPSQVAVLAIKSYEVFASAGAAERDPAQTATAIVEASRRFDEGRVLDKDRGLDSGRSLGKERSP